MRTRLRQARKANADKDNQPQNGNWLVPAFLLVTVIAVYSRVAAFGFVNYDDPEYVYENTHVNSGLSLSGVWWAFTHSYVANWHPLTWISHMIDFQIFGSNSGMQHLSNLFFHSTTTLLLFYFLSRITGSKSCGLFVAFGFALHPLHVESVAWISERKDVLSGLFIVGMLLAYAEYVRTPRPTRYLWVMGLFLCALLSKAIAVTFPFVLLVLDFWPLRRGRHIKEKLPLIGLSTTASIIAFLAQRGAGAVSSIDRLPLWMRLINLPVAVTTYLVQFVWPLNLSVFYPYNSSVDSWKVVVATISVMAISALAWSQRVTRPYLLVGWLWYLITLVPVIGIVQVGAQAHADRYTYLPFIGILLALALWAEELPSLPVRFVALGFGVFWAGLAWIQIGYWSDSISLFEHAITLDHNNYVAYNNLGEALTAAGRLQQAISAFQESVRSDPNFVDAHYNLGTALMDIPGREPDAVRELQTAITLDPGSAKARNNLGKVLAKTSVPASALAEQFEAALRADPGQAVAHMNLANASAQQGKFQDALREYQAALQLDSSRADIYMNMANVLASIPGRLSEAIDVYRTAVRMAPQLPEAHYNLANALAQAGRIDDAIAEYGAALKVKPDLVQAHNDLGILYAQMPGRFENAVTEFETAIHEQPNSADAHLNLGRLLSQTPGRSADAIRELEKAEELRPDPQIHSIIQQLRRSR